MVFRCEPSRGHRKARHRAPIGCGGGPMATSGSDHSCKPNGDCLVEVPMTLSTGLALLRGTRTPSSRSSRFCALLRPWPCPPSMCSTTTASYIRRRLICVVGSLANVHGSASPWRPCLLWSLSTGVRGELIRSAMQSQSNVWRALPMANESVLGSRAKRRLR